MLRLDAVTVDFGARRALDAVDLEVADHETVCVLGPSGSGKSTLLRVVAGLQDPAPGGCSSPDRTARRGRRTAARSG